MVAPVKKHSPEVNHGKSGQPAPRCGFLDAFLYRRNKSARNCPAENLVDELKPSTQRQRFQTDPAVAKLPVTPALLLMPALGAGAAADRLPVRHLGRLERHFRVIPAAPTLH